MLSRSRPLPRSTTGAFTETNLITRSELSVTDNDQSSIQLLEQPQYDSVLPILASKEEESKTERDLEYLTPVQEYISGDSVELPFQKEQDVEYLEPLIPITEYVAEGDELEYETEHSEQAPPLTPVFEYIEEGEAADQ